MVISYVFKINRLYNYIKGVSMDYERIYNQLIANAKTRGNVRPAERHHIIPKSMGGNNKKANIVELTPREHFIAHLLLWKIHRNVSMSYAMWQMSHTRGFRLNSRMYADLKSVISLQVSAQMSGKIVSQETRDKMSKSFTGRIFTDEHKANIGKASTGRTSSRKGVKLSDDEESIRIRSVRRTGKGLGNAGWPGPRSVEYRDKISEAGLGHKPYNFKRVSIDGVIYGTATEAARKIGITYNNLMRRLREEKYVTYFYVNKELPSN